MIRKIVAALHPMGGRTETAYGQDRRTVPCPILKRSEHPPQNYDDEPAAREAIALIENHTMLSYPRLVTLWQQVCYLDRTGIEGCLVECGTWKGGAAALMGLAHRRAGEACRDLHLFDSFQGLPEPDRAHDGEMAVRYAGERAAGRLQSIGKCVGTLEDNKHVLTTVARYPASLTHYHVGWFQDTLPIAGSSLKKIGLLRIDGDWYESTRICLETLFPMVSSGGIVVIDDYGKWAGCRKAVDEFMETLPRRLLMNHIDAAGRYIIVP